MDVSSRFDRISDKIEAMIQSSEMYELFLDASPWGILVTDRTFHIVHMNKPLQVMSGYSLHELLGQHIHVLMPEPDRSRHAEHEKKYVKKPYPRTGNHGLDPKILHKNGKVVKVEVSISPTKIHGETYFFASIRPFDTLFDSVEGREKGK